MNRYPLWKYIIMVAALAFGFLYTLPNFYGESPSVQVSSGKVTVKVDETMLGRVEDILKTGGVAYTGAIYDPIGVKVRFADTDTQLKARDLLTKQLNPDPQNESYVIALNLLPSSPNWLTAIHARPMYLGLDLRGGVHFLLQVDMRAALTKKLDSVANDVRSTLRDKNVRHSGVTRERDTVLVKFRDAATRETARGFIADTQADMLLTTSDADGEFRLSGALKPVAQKNIQDTAIKQNIVILHNRVNELGVAEPVVQQQGVDRIVVELPGVLDPARAQGIIGRTATLQVRLVDEEAMASGSTLNVDLFPEHSGQADARSVPMKKQVILTGDRFTSAASTFDQNQRPAVSIDLDAAGGRVMRDITRENIHHQMAIVLIEKGKGEAISVATIQGEFSNRFQITGNFSPEETNNLALLIRAGALAAPMEIIETRTIGPSLGADNITKGFKSTQYGFLAIAAFMIAYYLVFGVISILALASNLLFLVALLSLLQATLTLPGIAAIALALGMAIDANVLINERIREELRNGATPQAAITAGYERAFGTIVDSNITTLIAGLALLIFGSGAIRGFAVVHCLGILTSIFSAVFLSRGLVNLYYGSRRKLSSVSIGQVWKPAEPVKQR